MGDNILKHFSDALSYLEIVELFKHVNDFQTCLSTLKRWLKDSNIKKDLSLLMNKYDEQYRKN